MGNVLPMTTAPAAKLTESVMLLNNEGLGVALDSDPDARMGFEFAKVTEALAFVRQHFGKMGYQLGDDGIVRRTKVVAFRYVHLPSGNDITAEARQLITR